VKNKLSLLYSAQEIARRIDELALQIRLDYGEEKDFLCVCVLKGAFMFFSDLVKKLGSNALCAFIRLSSYGNETKSCGSAKLVCDICEDVSGKDVLIIEDIVDEGHTLSFLKQYFAQKNAASVRACCLVDKPAARVQDVRPDYTAFTLTKPHFVVGYGLDYAQRYRNLPALFNLE